MNVEVINRQRLLRVDNDFLAMIALKTFNLIQRNKNIPDNASLGIALVRETAIRKLNFQYRAIDLPTDVLSFQTPASFQHLSLLNNTEDYYLGDIVISVDTAARQARESGIDINLELAELTIHGVIHLCGYDHESDKGIMKRLELRIRRIVLDEPC